MDVVSHVSVGLGQVPGVVGALYNIQVVVMDNGRFFRPVNTSLAFTSDSAFGDLLMPLNEASFINFLFAFYAAITVLYFYCRLIDGLVFCGPLCLGEIYSATAKSTVLMVCATILTGFVILPLLPVGNHF